MRRDPEVASASWDAVPNPTGSAAWDALLAALVAREFESQQRPSPAWTRRVDQPKDPWLLHNPFFDDAEVRAQTPDWLASRGIYLAARDLVTA